MNRDRVNIKKFKKWLEERGAEILPTTNPYEAIRFKGRYHTGVLYTSGKTSGPFVDETIEAFKRKTNWDGAPLSTGRKNSYRKQKEKILLRDGANCFYCGQELGEDITLEHLIPLNAGGPNRLSNMVLAHEKCNQLAGHKSIVEKVNLAIKERSK